MEGAEAGGDGELHPLAEEAEEAWGERKRQNGREGVKVEDSNFGGFFFAYIHATWRHVKRYGPKWHNLTSSGNQISILQVHGPKWHLRTSLRTTGVFNSI